MGEPRTKDGVGRAVELVRAHSRRAELAALAFDVMSRQGQAKTLFTGREFIEARTVEHGVDRDEADTDWGNLVEILERGPSTERERSLVTGFALEGLRARLAEAGADERSRLLERFASHADWLVLGSLFDLYAFARAQLSERDLDVLWDLVGKAVLEDDEPAPAARARNAARLTVLSEAMSEAAERALARVAAEAGDVVVAAFARALGRGEPPGVPEEPPRGVRVRGRVGGAPSTSLRDALRIVTGIAAVVWLARALGNLVGLVRQAEMELVPGAVRVRRTTRLLGRTVREWDETYTLKAVAGAARSVRYPALHLLVGLLALAGGIIVGALWLFEGVASGETVLLVVAAGIILLGAGLDLALSVLVPARRGRVAVDLRVLSGRSVRLVRVGADEADRFLEALSRSLAVA